MRPDNPLPRACMLLAAFLPGIWLLARRWVRGAIDDRALGLVVTPAVAVCLWFLGVHVASRAAGSFVTGYVGATVLLGLSGYAARLLRGPHAPETVRGVPPWAMYVTGALATFAIWPLSRDYFFHDELELTGHLSVVAQMQNGTYPPRHAPFPTLEFGYHYGFNVIVAMVSGLAPLRRNEVVLDLVTMGFWLQSWSLLYMLGERLFGEGRGVIASLLLFGGGFSSACAANLKKAATLGEHLAGTCTVGGVDTNPPLLSYFFQHPWTVGLPIWVALYALHAPRRHDDPWARALLQTLLALSLCMFQFTLFAATLPSLMVSELLSGEKTLKRAAAIGAVGLSVAAVATQLGGFFAKGAGQLSGVVVTQGIAPDAASTTLWMALSYGLLLPLGLLGLGRLPGRELLALVGVGGAIVVNVARYRHTWDIVKFATASSLALLLPTAASLARLFDARSAVVRAFAPLLLLGCVAQGAALTFVLVSRVGVPSLFHVKAPLMSADQAALVGHLRRVAKPTELVLTDKGLAESCAIWGGLGVSYFDAQSRAFNLDAAMLERREAITAARPLVVSKLRDEGVRYLIYPLGNAELDAEVKRLRDEGEARQVGRFGQLTLLTL